MISFFKDILKGNQFKVKDFNDEKYFNCKYEKYFITRILYLLYI